jgi:hypothetical protein
VPIFTELATGWSDPVAGRELHPLKINTSPLRTPALSPQEQRQQIAEFEKKELPENLHRLIEQRNGAALLVGKLRSLFVCVSPNGTFWARAFESHNHLLLFIEILSDEEDHSPSEVIRSSRKATMAERSAESC